jgi:hypothetical protein
VYFLVLREHEAKSNIADVSLPKGKLRDISLKTGILENARILNIFAYEEFVKKNEELQRLI